MLFLDFIPKEKVTTLSSILNNVFMTGKLTQCVTCKGLLKHACSTSHGSTENDAKSNFLQIIYSELVLTPYSQGTQEISFKLHSFETLWRLMGK